MTKKELDEICARNPAVRIVEAGGRSQGAKLESPAGHEPLEAPQAETRHPGKYRVIVTSYRRRLLDEDNLAEKYHVDALRYAGLIPGDEAARCKIEVQQVKVNNKAEERTEIEIVWPC